MNKRFVCAYALFRENFNAFQWKCGYAATPKTLPNLNNYETAEFGFEVFEPPESIGQE